ncbi:hypothetical protein [Asticcacaulis sp.]|uniref:hypothetical protein n=1 Tax=Asticcacaulis sp. TaxID=1872648 RepID=UPI00260E6003|nr:hypothetical protein [Asticcacaulis sp.]
MAVAAYSTTPPPLPIARLLAHSSRPEIEAAIEALIAHLDALDGDPDSEPDADDEESDDREHDPCDFGEEEATC